MKPMDLADTIILCVLIRSIGISLQAIITAGFIPIIVDLLKVDDELRTDKQKIEREILSQGKS